MVTVTKSTKLSHKKVEQLGKLVQQYLAVTAALKVVGKPGWRCDLDMSNDKEDWIPGVILPATTVSRILQDQKIFIGVELAILGVDVE